MSVVNRRRATAILFALILGLAAGVDAPSPAVAVGPRLLVSTEGTVQTMYADGSGHRRVVAAQGVGDADWNPGGSRIAYARSCFLCPSTAGELRVVDADGSGDNLLLSLPTASVHNVDWSPDGRWIAFLVSTRATCWGCPPPPWELHVVGASDGLHLTFGPASEVVWSPDSQRIALSVGGAVFVAPAVTGGVPLQVSSGQLRASNPSWSPEGRHLAFLGRLREASVTAPPHVFVADPARPATDLEARELQVATFRTPTWSPDGTAIATVNAHSSDVEVTTVAGHRRALGLRSGNVYAAGWSPDGRTIAYVARPHGIDRTDSVRSVRPDGSDDREVMGSYGSIGPHLRWTP